MSEREREREREKHVGADGKSFSFASEVLTKISLQVGWICFSACGMMAWHFVCTLSSCDSFFKAISKKSFGCLVGVLHLFVF